MAADTVDVAVDTVAVAADTVVEIVDTVVGTGPDTAAVVGIAVSIVDTGRTQDCG